MIDISANQHRTFADILAHRAMDQRDSPAFVFLDGRGQTIEQVTFGELYGRVRDLAGTIHQRGYAGRNLVMMLPTGLDFVVALFACFRAGAIAVPVPSLSDRRSLERAAAIVRDARPTAILTSRILQADAAALAIGHDGLPIACMAVDDAGTSGDLPPVTAQSGDVALLQYTSGSTATPNGVMLTHGNLLANNQMIAEAFGHDETSRGVSWLPLFHDMGLIGHVLQPVFVGGLSVLLPPLSFIQRPVRWLEAISAWRATTSGGPSYAYALCADKIAAGKAEGIDLSSWRVAYCGSEPVRAAILKRFAQRFAGNGFRQEALQPCYGLAEATLLATSRAPGEGLYVARPAAQATASIHEAVSCGRPWAGGKIAIVNAESGVPADEGQVGEVCISGPHVAAGYWRRPAESADVFRGDANEHGHAVLRTGDLGFLCNGELFVLGRLKDTIIVFGEKHAAEDIEATVALSDPLFEGSSGAAFAVSQDSADGSEKPVIVQEVRAKHADGETLLRAARNAAAAVIRAHNLRLSDVVFVRTGTLPRTSSGKVRRAACRDLYSDGQIERLNPHPGIAAIAGTSVPT